VKNKILHFCWEHCYLVSYIEHICHINLSYRHYTEIITFTEHVNWIWEDCGWNPGPGHKIWNILSFQKSLI